jgi:hypothetical protein
VGAKVPTSGTLVPSEVLSTPGQYELARGSEQEQQADPFSDITPGATLLRECLDFSTHRAMIGTYCVVGGSPALSLVA